MTELAIRERPIRDRGQRLVAAMLSVATLALGFAFWLVNFGF